MGVDCHLTFLGQCADAFRFYERVLGGKIGHMQTYGESPGAEQLGPEWRDRIAHGTIVINGRDILGADVRAENYEKPAGFYLLLRVSGPAETERVFTALSDGGCVRMPLQKTFWSPAFGALVDRFGVPWEINCE